MSVRCTDWADFELVRATRPVREYRCGRCRADGLYEYHRDGLDRCFGLHEAFRDGDYIPRTPTIGEVFRRLVEGV